MFIKQKIQLREKQNSKTRLVDIIFQVAARTK